MVARIGVNEHLCAERVQATLTGYEEVPAVSTVASGEFRARVRASGQPWRAIASHDDLGLGPQRTLEDAIVGVVVGDRGDGLGGDNQGRKLPDRADRFLRPSRSPLELPDEHAFKLLQDREGDEELKLAGPRSGKHFVGHTAYVERGDVHVRVSDDAEHEQGRAGTRRPCARCRPRCARGDASG